jgi:hypothetical protein
MPAPDVVRPPVLAAARQGGVAHELHRPPAAGFGIAYEQIRLRKERIYADPGLQVTATSSLRVSMQCCMQGSGVSATCKLLFCSLSAAGNLARRFWEPVTGSVGRDCNTAWSTTSWAKEKHALACKSPGTPACKAASHACKAPCGNVCLPQALYYRQRPNACVNT